MAIAEENALNIHNIPSWLWKRSKERFRGQLSTFTEYIHYVQPTSTNTSSGANRRKSNQPASKVVRQYTAKVSKSPMMKSAADEGRWKIQKREGRIELEAVRRRRHEEQRCHNRGCARQKELEENDSNCGPHSSWDTTQLNGEEEDSICSACIATNNCLCLVSTEYKVKHSLFWNIFFLMMVKHCNIEWLCFKYSTLLKIL